MSSKEDVSVLSTKRATGKVNAARTTIRTIPKIMLPKIIKVTKTGMANSAATR
ncbi:hypothetical protein D3C78_1079480 [compost metagenome]